MGAFGVRRSILLAFVVVVAGNASIASASALTVSTTPSNYPSFSSSVSDYVIRGCPSTGGVSVNVTTDPGDDVSVDNQTPQTGTFTATANVTTGQEFTIVETSGSTTTGTWYMRCLPSDFPDFTSTVTGTPQSQFYLTANTQVLPGGSDASEGYAMFFDDNGVPIWWHSTAPNVAFANTDGHGDVAWTSHLAKVPVVTLAGKQEALISSPDGPIDLHELQFLGGGRVLLEVLEEKCCVDLSSWGSGFPTNASILDQVIEVIGPGNKVLWSWDAFAHLNPVVETNPQWYSTILASGSAYDVYHMNSVSYYNGSLLVSFRYLDAIYGINAATGNIFMKIGGNQDPESYTVLNDPVFSAGGTFCGQHDARILSATLITLHDNGSNCGRRPRAVEYSINPAAKTATLLTSVTDPRAPWSACCGSARLLPSGDWVIDWGDDPLFTEMTPTGSPVYTVFWTDPTSFAYRVTPILPGTYTAAELRAGMDAQYPNPAARTPSATK